MKLSISNIAWDKEWDEEMYDFLCVNRIEGIEIAPTRIFEENPYEKLKEASEFKKRLGEMYNLKISSMQSIWYGRQEQIFRDEKERRTLIEYTKHAFEFAHMLECHNLVFGCPRNRNMNSEGDMHIAEDFFGELGELAKCENTILSMEANPVIYHTNFLNYTKDAYAFVKTISSDGLKINYDLGTVIENGESIHDISVFVDEINHVHISEPNLVEVDFRGLHQEVAKELSKNNYERFVSIEMKNNHDIEVVKRKLNELQRYFK